MVRSTYLCENLTQSQIDLMLMLDEYEMDIFTLEELKQVADEKYGDVNELVENLVHKQILSRIERSLLNCPLDSRMLKSILIRMK